MSEQRKPIDGVACLIWYCECAMQFAYWKESDTRWYVLGTGAWIDAPAVANWTTIAECRSAPQMVEALKVVDEWFRSQGDNDEHAVKVRDALDSIEKEKA